MPHLWVVCDGKTCKLFKRRSDAISHTTLYGDMVRRTQIVDPQGDMLVVRYSDRKDLRFYPQTIEGTEMGLFTEPVEGQTTTLWCVQYSTTGRVALFFNKQTAMAHIAKQRGPCQSTSSHGSEIVFHYEKNYSVRMYPADVILTDV